MPQRLVRVLFPLVTLMLFACRGPAQTNSATDASAQTQAVPDAAATQAFLEALPGEVELLTLLADAVPREDGGSSKNKGGKALPPPNAQLPSELFAYRQLPDALPREVRLEIIKKLIDRIGRVIGDNDQQTVSELHHPQFAVLTGAVGLLRKRTCTVTYIGNGLALTAGHCLKWSAFDAPNEQPCPEGWEIEWQLLDGRPAARRSTCERILAASYQDLGPDYLIMRIAGPSLPARAVTPWCSESVVAGELTLLSHPGGGPLTYAGRCRVQESGGLALKSGVFAHDCDTVDGSSGGALLDATRHCIVGIHNGGRKLPVEPGHDARAINYATRVSATRLVHILPQLQAGVSP